MQRCGNMTVLEVRQTIMAETPMRSDPDTAEATIRAVFAQASGDSMDSYLALLVEVIDFLSSHYSDRWGITLFEWGLRLNVGWVECLVLHSQGLRILVEKDIVPGSTRLDGIVYKQAIGCDMTTVSLSELRQSLPHLKEALYSAIAIVGRSKSPRQIRQAHSVGVIDFLSRYARRNVSNPSYVSAPNRSIFGATDEVAASTVYAEGARMVVMVNRFERDSNARDACIAHYGSQCSVCDMSFLDRYGETMKDFIHVHHLVPLSTTGVTYQVDPIADLRPVCPNCHAVIHREDPPLSIGEARKLL